MPTYDYECQSCGHSFDQFQSMSDDPLKDCPSCGEPALKRLVSGGIGVIFKGSGFYVTDNKASSSQSKSETKKAGESAGENDGNASASSSSAAESDGGGSNGNGSNGDGSSSQSSGSSARTKTSSEKAG